MKKRRPAKTKYLKLLRLVILAVVVLVSGALLGFGGLAYKISHPAPAAELLTPASFLMPSEDVSWVSGDGVRFEGFWIPGKKGAPGIVLAPGYGMRRSTALSLAASLRNKGFHSLVYEQRGSGATPGERSTLGLRETMDMLAAVDFMRSRTDADSERSGIWGVDIGARAALNAAAERVQVLAIAADSPYDSVEDFLKISLREMSGFSNMLFELGCREGFRLYHSTSAGSMSERLSLAALANRKILFIAGENRPALAQQTRLLYEALQPRQEIVTLAMARATQMTGAELAIYDRDVSDFFSRNLAQQTGRNERGRTSAGDRPVRNGELQHSHREGRPGDGMGSN